MVSGDAKFDAALGRLAFDPTKARVLNVGTSDMTIVVSASGGGVQFSERAEATTLASSGDTHFLASLPAQLQSLGNALLRQVRSKFPGELKFYPDSGRYIDTPDNFWTIKPQPRDVSLRITVRGKPESFRNAGTLQPKPDRHGYSTFKIEKTSQIEDFVQLLGQARRK